MCKACSGEFDKVTVYSEEPLQMALKWESLGAEYLHVVDLDGARTGETQNISITSEIAAKLKIPVQLGGGIRSIEVIEKLISKGIKRVILGTSAVKNPDLVKQAVEAFKESIVIGIDAKDGKVAIDGWEKQVNLQP